MNSLKIAPTLILLAALAVTPGQVLAINGSDIYKQVTAEIGIYDDPELAAYIEGLVMEVVAVSEMAGEKFTVTLLDAPDVNAFATEDNYVYVNRGLLAYVQNEAQLVSVLAHEVAHITEKHVGEAQAQSGGAKALAMIASMLSGSPEVYDAGMAYANSLIRGRGRENEIEADRTGARYMATLGYDPNETIEMLSVMKDMELMMKDRAAAQGATRRTYHGIFSTHPRNDLRLRQAVSNATRIETSGSRGNGEDRFRQMTDGMVWGENFKEKEREPTRWADMNLRVRFDYPDGWAHQTDSQARSVTGAPTDNAATLSMKYTARTAQEPEEFLYNYLNIGQLRDGKAISPARLKGYTGILPGENGKPDQRIAVVYYKLNAYIFTGEVADISQFRDFDGMFLESVDTFRPISGREIVGSKPRTLHYVKATSSTTFEALGKHLSLKPSQVDELRLINGYYPDGEPKAGDWIKIIQQT